MLTFFLAMGMSLRLNILLKPLAWFHKIRG
jgi:hypothetical protein